MTANFIQLCTRKSIIYAHVTNIVNTFVSVITLLFLFLQVGSTLLTCSRCVYISCKNHFIVNIEIQYSKILMFK